MKGELECGYCKLAFWVLPDYFRVVGATLGRPGKFKRELKPLYLGLWWDLNFSSWEFEALMARAFILLSLPDLLSGI